MRFSVVASLLLLVPGAFAVTASRPAAHRITPSQARELVKLVAQHDDIDLSDTHIEMNSLDLMSPFVPGYASYILIREATTPGPDQTLRRYAVNRRTGDVWEMTLCRRYNFPQLEQMQHAFTERSQPSTAQLAAESRELGCEGGGGRP
jgi:hypothetical protein